MTLDRNEIAQIIRKALVENWSSYETASKWDEDVLLTGCKKAGNGMGYQNPEQAAQNLTLDAADAVIAALSHPSGERVMGLDEPTKAAILAGEEAFIEQYENQEWEEAKDAAENIDVAAIYRAMIAASPVSAVDCEAVETPVLTPVSDTSGTEKPFGCMVKGYNRVWVFHEWQHFLECNYPPHVEYQKLYTHPTPPLTDGEYTGLIEQYKRIVNGTVSVDSEGTWRGIVLEAAQALLSLQQKNKELEERLEISFAFNGKGERIPFKEGWPDGISCRDETIRNLEAQLEALKTDLERKDKALGSQAAQDVLAERRRQVEAEYWTPEHDDAHSHGEMALAAACYALTPNARRIPLDNDDYIRRRLWPWDLEWWKPKDRRRDLVKAAALILAEIERLDRSAPSPAKDEGR